MPPASLPLSRIESWPVPNVAAAIVGADGSVRANGDTTHSFRLASISKVITTWAALVAVEEGNLSLATPIGQEGCTLRHLLSHAGGYAFDGVAPIARPGKQRIYSNTGIELAAHAIAAATGMSFDMYLHEAILAPLEMSRTRLVGSPAAGIWSSVGDVVRFIAEIIAPSLLDPATVADAMTVQFPELNGTIPGLGSYRPCPWGLGGEIRGHKAPHWTGIDNSPATYGHFGGSGTMMWVDPVAGLSLVALTDRNFDDWSDDALQLWPELSDAVLAG